MPPPSLRTRLGFHPAYAPRGHSNGSWLFELNEICPDSKYHNYAGGYSFYVAVLL